MEIYSSPFHAIETDPNVVDNLVKKADLAVKIRDLYATLSKEEICKKFSITESEFENLIRGIL